MHMGGLPQPIRDFQGTVKKIIAYKNGFGMWCRVYWFTAVGHCELLEDGASALSS